MAFPCFPERTPLSVVSSFRAFGMIPPLIIHGAAPRRDPCSPLLLQDASTPGDRLVCASPVLSEVWIDEHGPGPGAPDRHGAVAPAGHRLVGRNPACRVLAFPG